MKKEKMRAMSNAALLAALLCICGPICVPIGTVPVSITSLVLMVGAAVLGYRLCLTSYLIYVFLGIVGVPVFAGFNGGAGALLGVTGGYLFGFLFLILTTGISCERSKGSALWTSLGMTIGMIATYICGALWFMVQSESSFEVAIMVCVVPFLIVDALKVLIALNFMKVRRKPYE